MGTTRVVFPPQFEPFQPYLSGPYLKSLLSQHDLDASVFDANIDFYEWMVGFAGRQVPWATVPHENRDYLHANVKHAVGCLRSRPGSLHEYRWAINVVEEYLRAISPVGVEMGLTCMRTGHPNSAQDLLDYSQDPNSAFALYFEDAADDLLGPPSVQTYLLSVVVRDQLAAAVVLCGKIKEHRPNARVIIGGPLVSQVHSKLVAMPWIRPKFPISQSPDSRITAWNQGFFSVSGRM